MCVWSLVPIFYITGICILLALLDSKAQGIVHWSKDDIAAWYGLHAATLYMYLQLRPISWIRLRVGVTTIGLVLLWVGYYY